MIIIGRMVVQLKTAVGPKKEVIPTLQIMFMTISVRGMKIILRRETGKLKLLVILELIRNKKVLLKMDSIMDLHVKGYSHHLKALICRIKIIKIKSV